MGVDRPDRTVVHHPTWHSENGEDKLPKSTKTDLVGGFNPSEKYDRQNGNLPQIGVKIKNI